MNSSKLSAFGPIVTIGLVILCTTITLSLAKENSTETLEDIKKYDACIIKSMFSFLHPQSYPPRTKDEFKAICRSQSEGFKCLKEQSKGAVPIIRRGILALVATRQRQHKKICTNLDSDQSKKFMAASKCVMDTKLSQLKENDMKILRTMAAIEQRNYNDSGPELKQICCAMYNYKTEFGEISGQSCSSHGQMLDELIGSIITDDISIICEDDEKMAKVCPKIEKLSNDLVKNVTTTASTTIYLIATLGEPKQN